jgi:pimeloyl-ACP methyl ester carboxylesterase
MNPSLRRTRRIPERNRANTRTPDHRLKSRPDILQGTGVRSSLETVSGSKRYAAPLAAVLMLLVLVSAAIGLSRTHAAGAGLPRSGVAISSSPAFRGVSTNRALVGHSAGAEGRRYTPMYEAAPCPMPFAPELTVECGYVTVPENRARPRGSRVRLAIARVRSPAPEGAASPVVFLAGGPGGEALTRLAVPASAAGPGSNPLLATHDLIYFDQRGVGNSQPNLDCPERDDAVWTNFARNAPFPTEFQTVLDAVQRCRARLVAAGVDLRAYDSVASAADIADIRTAMHIRQWNLWGVSYGTALAQEVLRSQPAGVRSAILDSVLPVDNTSPRSEIDSGQRAFNALLGGCEHSTSCHQAYPDLQATLEATLASYDASPLVTSVVDQHGISRPVSLDGADVLAGLFNVMYDTNLIPQLPSIIQQMHQRTFPLGQAIQQAIPRLFGYSEGMHYSVMCRDRLGSTRTAEVIDLIKHHPHYSLIYQLNAPAVCESWLAGTMSPRFNKLVASEVPALVLAGEYDPVTPPDGGRRVARHLQNSTFVPETPPAGGRRVARRLQNATFVEFRGTGHGVFRTNPCAEQIVVAFVAHPTSRLDSSCVDTIAAPTFAVPNP